MDRGIDYAWQHPDPAAIAAAGYRFACRYLSRDVSKNLTLSEAKALAAHRIWVVANWEYGAQDMLRGYAGGVADATLALAQATVAGMPKGRPIYFSADWDVTPAQESAVTAYLKGAASVLGPAAVGEYAGFYPVRIARDNGTAAWTWQTFGWSGGQWDPRDTVRQTGSTTVGGVSVDVNQAMVMDYGQWQPGVVPAVPPAPRAATQEDNVYLISVSPDPTQPGTTGTSGIFAVHEGLGPVHVDSATYADTGFDAKFGPAYKVSTAYYNALVAAAAKPAVSVDATALAAALAKLLPAAPTADQNASAVVAHLEADLAKG